jgi:hypothetical protein
MIYKKLTIRITFLILALFFVQCNTSEPDVRRYDLQQDWDSLTVLENPYKGWYHHLLDNGLGIYKIEDEAMVDKFPGMDHMYLRLAWSYLEQEEGVYDWSRIDEVVEKYVPRGYGISFRITSLETGPPPNSVAEEVDGVCYATPHWVRKSGAAGQVVDLGHIKTWVPDWDDPVYLEKLSNFHKAFAARYDGKPWVRYVDVGSIGDWGEGHTFWTTKIPPTLQEVKANMEVYLKHYKKTQIVVTDDLLTSKKSEAEVAELYYFAVSNGISLRDDSIMHLGWLESHLASFSVYRPDFYRLDSLRKPVVLEMAHYRNVLNDRLWLGLNGRDTIPGKGIAGADIMEGAIRLMHATYIGYHGPLERWLEDNPDLAGEMANLCGYWYFPASVEIGPDKNQADRFKCSITWLNKGVAPAYHSFDLELKVETEDGKLLFEGVQNTSDNRSWMPDEHITEDYLFPLPTTKGQAKRKLKVRLSDELSGQEIKLGLKGSARDEDGYYTLCLF